MLKPPIPRRSPTKRMTRNRQREPEDTSVEAGSTAVPGSSTPSVQDSEASPEGTRRATTPSVTHDEGSENAQCRPDCAAEKPASAASRGRDTSPELSSCSTSRVDEDAMDVDVVKTPTDSKARSMPSSTVPVTRFYGSSPSKRMRRETAGSVVVVDSEDETDRRQEDEVSTMLEVMPPDSLAQ